MADVREGDWVRWTDDDGAMHIGLVSRVSKEWAWIYKGATSPMPLRRNRIEEVRRG